MRKDDSQAVNNRQPTTCGVVSEAELLQRRNYDVESFDCNWAGWTLRHTVSSARTQARSVRRLHGCSRLRRDQRTDRPSSTRESTSRSFAGARAIERRAASTGLFRTCEARTGLGGVLADDSQGPGEVNSPIRAIRPLLVTRPLSRISIGKINGGPTKTRTNGDWRSLVRLASADSGTSGGGSSESGV